MSAPQHYNKVEELTAGIGITGGHRAVMIKAGSSATVVTLYVYPQDYQHTEFGSFGTTGSVEIAVPANTTDIIPIRVAEYNSGTNSPKVYGLN
tara:strand:- start:668 stop:946 length:279 start_codon:yes stop_codon:yes gene_type:complete